MIYLILYYLRLVRLIYERMYLRQQLMSFCQKIFQQRCSIRTKSKRCEQYYCSNFDTNIKYEIHVQ